MPTEAQDRPPRPAHPLRRIVKSFPWAANGIVCVIRHQTNAWIHLLATVIVIGLGIGLRVDLTEWCLLLLAIGLVWGLEAANTAVELLADAVHPGFHPLVGQAKDAAAGAVLLASIAAAIVGLLIFVPKVWTLLSS